MLWLHRTALFQTAFRTERKPEFWGKEPALEMGDGISGWPKLSQREEGERPSMCVPKRKGSQGKEFGVVIISGDRTEVLGSLRGE